MHGKKVDNGNKIKLPLRSKVIIVMVYIKSKLLIVVFISDIFDYTKYT